VNLFLLTVWRTPWPGTLLNPVYGFFTGRQGGDSWRGLVTADGVVATMDRSASIYDRTFFDPALTTNNFLYPPTALLVIPPAKALLGERWLEGLRALTWLFIPVTAVFVFLIAWRGSPRTALIALVLSAGVTVAFYPVMRSYRNGQIQTWINAAFAASLWLLLVGRPTASGALMGLACLLKPQWLLLLAWAALRREWRFATGLAVPFAAGVALSIALYGLASHLEFRRVIGTIAWYGESLYANQSVNGLLHRVLFNGGNLSVGQHWLSHFPPFHPVVYAGTLISSVVVLALAFLPRIPREERDGPMDFATVALAATMASPMAWDHHYGILLPIFALLYRRLAEGRLPLGPAAVAGIAYVVATTHVHDVARLADTRWNVFPSLLFFAALTLFIVLLRVRRAAPGLAGGGGRQLT